MTTQTTRKVAIAVFALIIVLLMSWDTLFGPAPKTGLYESMKATIIAVGYSVN